MSIEATTIDRQLDALPLTISYKAKRFVKGRRLMLMQRLEDVVKTIARQERVGIVGIEVEYADLMKEMGQPFLTMVVRTGAEVSPDRALDYWTMVGDRIDQSTLDMSIDKMFAAGVTISVEWVEPDAG